MRLPDIINRIRRMVSEGSNIVRHPGQAAFRVGRKKAQTWYENAPVPGFDNKGKTQSETAESGNRPDENGTVAHGTAAQSTAVSGERSQNIQGRETAVYAEAFAGDDRRRSHQTPHHTATPNIPSQNFESPLPIAAPLPTLQAGHELKGGWQGSYMVGNHISQLPWLRLYEGVAVNGNDPVWIHEYVWQEEDFNVTDAKTRLGHFRKLINQNLQLGKGSDFRLIKIEDVILEAKGIEEKGLEAERQQRCGYLITQPIEGAITLATYLEQKGGMSAEQVCAVLEQVLQSLRYLHTAYRVRWIDGSSARGSMVHGNLTLDSLWIREDSKELYPGRKPFFVYLSRFALWEHVCWPLDQTYRLDNLAKGPSELGTVAEDLADLGRIAFALLSGAMPEGTGQFTSSPLMEQVSREQWLQVRGAKSLRPFILRLLGKGSREEPFRSADTALVELSRLKAAMHAPTGFPEAEGAALSAEASAVLTEDEFDETMDPPADKPRSSRLFLWLLFWLGLVAIAAGLLKKCSTQETQVARESVEMCGGACSVEQALDEPLSVNYTIEGNSAWIIGFSHFVGDSLSDFVESQKRGYSLERLLMARTNGDLKLQRISQESLKRDALLTAFKRPKSRSRGKNRGKEPLQLALMEMPTFDKDSGITQETVARDGIVFFVVFSDEKRSGNIPKELNGKITLEALGRLYANSADSPQAKLGNKNVRLYFPGAGAEEEADKEKEGATVALLKQQLKELSRPNSQNKEKAIEFDEAAFNQLEAQDEERAKKTSKGNAKDIYARMLKDFEDASTGSEDAEPEIIGIGFNRLSHMLGQCSVYPLEVKGRDTYSPFVEASGDPITPKTDLCGDKGGYWANSSAFEEQEYPFAYDLSVVYPSCENDANEAKADDANADDASNCKGEKGEAGETFANLLKTPEGQYLLSQVGLVPLTPIDELNRMLWPEDY